MVVRPSSGSLYFFRVLNRPHSSPNRSALRIVNGQYTKAVKDDGLAKIEQLNWVAVASGVIIGLLTVALFAPAVVLVSRSRTRMIDVFNDIPKEEVDKIIGRAQSNSEYFAHIFTKSLPIIAHSHLFQTLVPYSQ